MKDRNSISGLGSMAVLIAGALISSAAVVAEPLPEITIQGSRISRAEVQGQRPGYPPSEVIQLSRTVDYSDIDASTASGAKKLENRVAETAKSVCSELDGLAISRDQDCVKRTIDAAKNQVDAAIKAAEMARTAAR